MREVGSGKSSFTPTLYGAGGGNRGYAPSAMIPPQARLHKSILSTKIYTFGIFY